MVKKMKNISHSSYPERIVCMTEESVELLYDLGLEHKIVGVSTYVRRPEKARKLPTVTAFTHANLKKILHHKPDLVLGFSDIQKDIARDLIGAGLNVFITNQRSITEIFSYLRQISALVGAAVEGDVYVSQLEEKFYRLKSQAQHLKRKPNVYIEEWDEPMITGIHWFCELVQAAGGEVCFAKKSQGAMAQERFVSAAEVREANPDIILACWCGKKVDIHAIKSREGWSEIEAVKNDQVIELAPEIFLQPGPALFKDGLEILIQVFEKWSKNQV